MILANEIGSQIYINRPSLFYFEQNIIFANKCLYTIVCILETAYMQSHKHFRI